MVKSICGLHLTIIVKFHLLRFHCTWRKIHWLKFKLWLQKFCGAVCFLFFLFFFYPRLAGKFSGKKKGNLHWVFLGSSNEIFTLSQVWCLLSLVSFCWRKVFSVWAAERLSSVFHLRPGKNRLGKLQRDSDFFIDIMLMIGSILFSRWQMEEICSKAIHKANNLRYPENQTMKDVFFSST